MRSKPKTRSSTASPTAKSKLSAIDSAGEFQIGAGRRTSPPSGIVDVALVLVAVVWGVSYLTVKTVAHAVPVNSLLVVRFGLANLMFIALWRLNPVRLTRELWRTGVPLGVVQAACISLEAWGVTLTSAAHGGLIISLAIILTPLLEGFVRRGHLPAHFYALTALSLGGVTMLVLSRGFTQLQAGDFLFLAAALLRAIYMVWLGYDSQRYALNPIALNVIAFGVSTMAIAVCSPQSIGKVAHLTSSSWIAVVYLAAISTVLAFLVQTWAIARTSAARVGLLMGTEPLWAVVAATTIGHERLSIWAVIGGAAIVIGTSRAARAERIFRELRN